MDGVECLTASKRRWVMLCILLGLGLSSLGSAIVNIALPNISRSFESSDAATVWVVNAYQLSATVCLLLVASLAESLGLGAFMPPVWLFCPGVVGLRFRSNIADAGECA
ncbi:MFS transporter [Bradyrhizobium paxllaeri]|uniref:MFS transporter n=1 Tax=Bradyrhizobium paxllaeri TaxID=190148 RepID=UPI000A97B9B4|nr:MFS transporter [Bradyrhizobium paxllaeri]